MPFKNKKERQEYVHNHYLQNKSRYKDAANKSHLKTALIIDDIKKQNTCHFCSENHPICLDFHHVDPTIKDDTISRLLTHKGLGLILKEIIKCVVVCSNCHRKLHANVLKLPLNIALIQINWENISQYYTPINLIKIKKQAGF